MAKLYITLLALADRLRSDDEGATAVEYGLMVALIAVAIAVIVGTLGTHLRAVFTTVDGALP